MRPRRASHGASHKGDGLGDYPRVCEVCGERVLITGLRSLYFNAEIVGRGQVLRSYHADCWLSTSSAPR